MEFLKTYGIKNLWNFFFEQKNLWNYSIGSIGFLWTKNTLVQCQVADAETEEYRANTIMWNLRIKSLYVEWVEYGL